jgi:hypothetical protein
MEALQRVPDPRSRFGKSYPLPAVLARIVLGMLVGRRSLAGIARLIDHDGPELALAPGFRHHKTPTAMMLSLLLRRLDVRAFEQILTAWIGPFLPDLDPTTAEPTPAHLDGKTLRGSGQAGMDLPGAHLVALFAPPVQGVLAPMRVDAQTNEHQAALELLDILARRSEGHVITGDAAFCQREICEKIIGRGDDYLLTVKDNQPSRVTDIDAGLSDAETARTFSPTGRIPRSEVPLVPQFFAKTVEKSRGRIEIRTIETTSVRTCCETWKGLNQGFRRTRTITREGKTTTVVVHGITSRSKDRADATRLLELVRQPGRMENPLHDV